MSEHKNPGEAKKAAQRNSSRSVVIGAVGVLIVVAIAGIVLAGRHSKLPADAGATGGASGSTQQAASAPTAINPNEVIFSGGSAKLPATAGESIKLFAATARAGGNSVRMSARFLSGENLARDRELAKGRTTAVQEALKADGIAAEKMQIELVEMPAGSLTEADSNRVDLTLR